MHIILPALVILGQGVEPDPGEASAVSKQTRQVNWTCSATLPLLHATPIKPIRNAELFERKHGRLKYHLKTKGPAASGEFENDDAALEAARKFLREHFGDLPLPVFLRRTVRDADVSSDPDGPDRLLSFGVRYNGIRLADGGATIYFKGREVVFAIIGLVSVAPVSGSERPIISKNEALDKLKKAVPEDWVEGIRPENLRLVYAMTIRNDKAKDAAHKTKDVTLLRPNWEVSSSILMIDALDGSVWRNG